MQLSAGLPSYYIFIPAYLVEGTGLVAGAVGAAPDLDLDAALPPLHHLVVHQIPRALVRAVIQHLFR